MLNHFKILVNFRCLNMYYMHEAIHVFMLLYFCLQYHGNTRVRVLISTLVLECSLKYKNDHVYSLFCCYLRRFILENRNLVLILFSVLHELMSWNSLEKSYTLVNIVGIYAS